MTPVSPVRRTSTCTIMHLRRKTDSLTAQQESTRRTTTIEDDPVQIADIGKITVQEYRRLEEKAKVKVDEHGLVDIFSVGVHLLPMFHYVSETH